MARRTSLSVLSLGLALGIALPVQADDARDPAAAEVHFRRGVELLKKDDWKSACEAFDASMKLDPSVGTQINVARCAAHDERLALAWAEFKRAEAMNAETPLEKRKREIDEFVKTEIAKLEPRLPWIRVVLSPKAAAGLTLARDGVTIPTVGLEVAVPIDPGEHTFTASAQGYAEVSRSVTIGEAERKTVDLTLSPLSPGEEPEKPGPAAKGAPGRTAEDSDAGGSPLVPAGVALAALGGASLVVSAVTGGVAFGDRQAIDALEDDGRCAEAGGRITCVDATSQAEAHDAIARGEPLALTSTITLFAGLAVAGTGAVLLGVGLASGSEATPAPAVSFAPWASPWGAGFVVGGAL